MTSVNRELQLPVMTRFLNVSACMGREVGGYVLIVVEFFMCLHKCLIDLN